MDNQQGQEGRRGRGDPFRFILTGKLLLLASCFLQSFPPLPFRFSEFLSPLHSSSVISTQYSVRIFPSFFGDRPLFSIHPISLSSNSLSNRPVFDAQFGSPREYILALPSHRTKHQYLHLCFQQLMPLIGYTIGTHIQTTRPQTRIAGARARRSRLSTIHPWPASSFPFFGRDEQKRRCDGTWSHCATLLNHEVPAHVPN